MIDICPNYLVILKVMNRVSTIFSHNANWHWSWRFTLPAGGACFVI